MRNTITYFIFLLSPFASFPFIVIDIYHKRKGSIFLFSCFMGILAYLYLPSLNQDGASRYFLYERFYDYTTYLEFYNGFLKYRADWLFYTLIYTFSKFGIKFQILLFLFALFNTYIPLLIFNKIVSRYKVSSIKYISLFILVFLTFSYSFLFSGIRNNIAFTFIFLSFYYLFYEDKKWWPYILLFLGIITHFSMIIYVPIFIFSKKINEKLLLIFIISATLFFFILPTDVIKVYFESIAFGNDTYDNKIQGYSITQLGNSNTTSATRLAKNLFWVWFYFSWIYIFTTFKVKRNKRYLIAYMLFSIPVVLFITFPAISHRYLFGLKFIFVLLLISDSFVWNNRYWRNVFIALLAIKPLYEVFRLLTQSFIAGYFRLNNSTLFQILIQSYDYEDMLPI